MYAWEIVELCATLFNIASNASMFAFMIKDTDQKVPKMVIYLQILGNLSWVTSSILRNDPYLGTTASCSLFMQCSTAFILNKKMKKITKIKDSVDKLPIFLNESS